MIQKKNMYQINPKLKSSVNVYDGVKDGFFHQEHSRLNEPAFELKGLATTDG